MGTPTEEVWEGLTKLPNFNTKFPVWNKGVKGFCPFEESLSCMDAVELDLLKHILKIDPLCRLSARDILCHKYFEGYKKINNKYK